MEDVFGFQDRRLGKLKDSLNPIFYANVVEIRETISRGTCRIENYFKHKGFNVSYNKMNQVIQQEGLTRKKMGKRKRKKYVRYDVDNINKQGSIDWSVDPLPKTFTCNHRI